ncbi:hypothetical protein D6C77_05691 [Aureobasidium pullulans]|nr:hypothetical protein D6C77_05691 [Aureobasidium pullulans]
MLLEYLELSQYFRLRNLIFLAQSVESWYDGKYHRDAAEDMWYSMRHFAAFSTNEKEYILEDRPENWYNPHGLIEYESGERFTSSAINEGDDTSPHFEPPTFLETTEKVIGDDRSVAFADTNKQDEPDSTLHLHDFHKLFAANKPGAEADRIESQTETIVTNKSSPDTLKIDGNMIEEANVQPDKSTKEKEPEPKNTLDKDKVQDKQPKCVSSQEEAAILDDIPSKKRKAADRPFTKVNEIQSVLSSQHKSYIEPSKQDVATILDDPAPNKRMKND